MSAGEMLLLMLPPEVRAAEDRGRATIEHLNSVLPILPQYRRIEGETMIEQRMRAEKEAARIAGVSGNLLKRYHREVVVIEFLEDFKGPRFSMKKGERWILNYQRSSVHPEPTGQAYCDHAYAFAFAGGQCLHTQVKELYHGFDVRQATIIEEDRSRPNLPFSDMPLRTACKLLGYEVGESTSNGRKRITMLDGTTQEFTANELWLHIAEYHPDACGDPGYYLGSTDALKIREKWEMSELVCTVCGDDTPLVSADECQSAKWREWYVLAGVACRSCALIGLCRTAVYAAGSKPYSDARAAYEKRVDTFRDRIDRVSRPSDPTIEEARAVARSAAWTTIMGWGLKRVECEVSTAGFAADEGRSFRRLIGGDEVGVAAQLVVREVELRIMMDEGTTIAGFSLIEDAQRMDDDSPLAADFMSTIDWWRSKLKPQFARYQLAAAEHHNALRLKSVRLYQEATSESGAAVFPGGTGLSAADHDEAIEILNVQRLRERTALLEVAWLAHELHEENHVAAMCRVLVKRRQRIESSTRMNPEVRPTPIEQSPRVYQEASEQESERQAQATIRARAEKPKKQEPLKMIQVSAERMKYARTSVGLSIKEVQADLRLLARADPDQPGVKIPPRKVLELSALESGIGMVDCYEWQVLYLYAMYKVRAGWLSEAAPMHELESQRVRDMLGK
jgi:hypothetical protein